MEWGFNGKAAVKCWMEWCKTHWNLEQWKHVTNHMFLFGSLMASLALADIRRTLPV